MTIVHHPSDELLLSYAAGATDEAASLVVATHLALCPLCRRTVSKAEAVGGALLESSTPVPLDGDAITSVLARLDDATAMPSALRPTGDMSSRVPEPLRSYIGADFNNLDWKKITSGLSFKPLFDRGPVRSVLIRSKEGCGVYDHTHRGEEFTLVLTGGFTDQTGHYARGDFQMTSPAIEHRLVTDEGEDCIVLAMTDAPVVFRNPLVGLMSKWFGF
jgi:putative transcriptional regulator